MSLVHELLYKNNELDFIPFDIYILQLTNIVASAFRSKPVHIIPEMSPCTLDIEIALPLGLVVNELLTNSFKYAFSEEGDGYLFMDLRVHESDQAGNPLTWKLTIRDNGKGLPEGYSMDSTKTLGSQIIKMLVHQVEGTVEASNTEGACFEIIFKQTID
jgi:two-component sensor histidine kinase